MKTINTVFLIACVVPPFLSGAVSSLSPREKEILQHAERKVERNDYFGAVEFLYAACRQFPENKLFRARCSALNKKIYLTALRPERTLYYTVQPGDSLYRIARKHAITVRLIKRLNGLKNSALKIGQVLKVVQGPFHMRIIKSRFELQVIQKKRVLFTYKVCTGKKGEETPEGRFKAGAKLVHPTQYDRENGRTIKYGEKDHTLGTRWITFSGPYGIHGTVDPGSIGRCSSKGCVRLLNNEVEEVYDLIVPGKSTIEIIDTPPRDDGVEATAG